MPEELLESLLLLMPFVVPPVTLVLGVTVLGVIPPFALGVTAPPAVSCATGLIPDGFPKFAAPLASPIDWGNPLPIVGLGAIPLRIALPAAELMLEELLKSMLLLMAPVV